MCSFSVIAFADEPDLTLDFNKRYTDISEYEDVNDPFLDFGAEKEAKEQKRNIYATILIVLLIIAIIIFIRTLKKTPALPENTKGNNKQNNYKDSELKEKTSLKDEEKENASFSESDEKQK